MPMDCSTQSRQHGAVAIITALSLVALVGFAGLALDLGRLYVNKTELQNAADACALAASRELTCDPSASVCTGSYLENAVAAGTAVAARNTRDFQGSAVTIAPGDVRFYTALAPNESYTPMPGADVNSRFVMCIARAQGIAPWFMQVLGIGANNVSAYAVATLSKAQTNCAIPIGLCKPPGVPPTSPFDGFTVGQWVTSKLTESATGSFDWIDFTPGDGGGASELANLLKGSGQCTLEAPGPGNQVGQQGNIASLGKAWNTRFGIYKGSDSVTSAPPDWTGISYTQLSWPEKFNAYAGTSAGVLPNYKSARSQYLPYQGPSLGQGYKPSTAFEHQSYGADRRTVVVPVVDCEGWKVSNPQTVAILGYACVLMLHPMTGENGPAAGEEVWLEYRGDASDSSSPCATAGSVGGPGSIGPLVPALVQ
ncbi:hypothetical protein AzCIB_4110 [Azoarcus sp. CIB]|nr:hypothetical protein AzCIB_4110 [Azoarcus sp. CIB]